MIVYFSYIHSLPRQFFLGKIRGYNISPFYYSNLTNFFWSNYGRRGLVHNYGKWNLHIRAVLISNWRWYNFYARKVGWRMWKRKTCLLLTVSQILNKFSQNSDQRLSISGCKPKPRNRNPKIGARLVKKKKRTRNRKKPEHDSWKNFNPKLEPEDR